MIKVQKGTLTSLEGKAIVLGSQGTGRQGINHPLQQHSMETGPSTGYLRGLPSHYQSVTSFKETVMREARLPLSERSKYRFTSHHHSAWCLPYIDTNRFVNRSQYEKPGKLIIWHVKLWLYITSKCKLTPELQLIQCKKINSTSGAHPLSSNEK